MGFFIIRFDERNQTVSQKIKIHPQGEMNSSKLGNLSDKILGQVTSAYQGKLPKTLNFFGKRKINAEIIKYSSELMRKNIKFSCINF